MNSVTKPILLIHLFLSVIVAIDVTCDRVNPLIQSDVACTCKTAPGTDIDWLIDDVFNSNCVLSSKCAPQYSGYSYSMNTTENVFMMTINSYDYSSCTKITCKDESDGSIKQSIIPSSLVFDTTFPTSMTEPGSNNSNGIIFVTTGCISGFMDVQYDWYIIIDGLEERYFVYDTNIIDTFDNSPCVNCDTDVNGQRTIGFEHSEASGSGTKTGLFKVSLYHVSTNFQLNLTSRYFYTVKVRSGPTSKSWCWFDESYACIIIIIIIIVAGLAILSYLLAALIYLNQQSSKQLIKDMTFEKRRLFIPCFGLSLIIRHLCIYCKLKKGRKEEQNNTIQDKIMGWMESHAICIIIMKETKDVLSSMEPEVKIALCKAMKGEEQERIKKLTERLDRISEERYLIESQDQLIGELIRIEEQDRINERFMIQKTRQEQQHKQELKNRLECSIKNLKTMRNQAIHQEEKIIKTIMEKEDGISKELDWLKGREKQRKESLEEEKGGIKNELDMMKEQDKRRDRILMEKTELTVDDTFKMYIKQDKEFSSFIMSELRGNTAIRMEIERGGD